MVNLGNGLCQIWINTNQNQPTGVGTWLLFYSVNIVQAGGSGGGDSGGSGGGDAGD